ncbi:actin-related protein 8-like isoform X7 [Diospyros lotus]|uniref:actin-related protein 8-like isoform X7 n=1 Tax=Diospyros lotus TaxID=55363 RepID=UPI002252B5DD|nr:actin-related protein 8-like isoform X7 [Diospyros lotus]
MAALLRKVWQSVSSRAEPTRNTPEPEAAYGQSSTGEFDRLPVDIFTQILKLLGPKEAARLVAVCKSWKLIVSKNRLWIYFLQNQEEPWDSIFFAETHLRLGHPLQALPNQISQLSFMEIYGQRAQVPGSIIIDGGSGYCKFGWSKYARPSGQCATFVEFGNIESPAYSRVRHFFSTIYSRMHLKTTTQPVVVSLPICHYDVLHGKVMRKVGVEVLGVGALKLTTFLRDLMQQKNIHFESIYTVRSLKENLCYIALDYEAELSKDTQASFEVAPEGWFTLSKERFQTGEILFQPHIAGVRALGLQRAVAICINRCQAAELTGDDTWFKTVVLTGGSACLPGLAGRLEKELSRLLPHSVSSGIRVISAPYGVDSAWFGAKLISNLFLNPQVMVCCNILECELVKLVSCNI